MRQYESALSCVLNDTIQEKLLREESFYVFCKEKIAAVFNKWKKGEDIVVVYFDLDETLVSYGENTLRPGGELLLLWLKKQYGGSIQLGILSARGQENIFQFVDTYTEFFNREHCISSRKTTVSQFEEQQMIKEGRGKGPSGHYNKVKAFTQLQQKNSKVYSILVDDIIQDSFEQKKTGFTIPDNLFSTLSLETYS